MSALTTIRKPGTDQALAEILSLLQSHRFEGADAVSILYELHGSLVDTDYMQFGSVSLEDVADTVSREVRDFGQDCSHRVRRPMPDWFPSLNLNNLTIRGVPNV